MKHTALGILLCTCLVLLSLAGCSGLRTDKDPYAETWEAVVRSQNWKRALELNPDTAAVGQVVYFALPEWTDGSAARANPEFVQTYPKLVSRAYFRLIAEALRADRRVKSAFQERYLEANRPENRSNRRMQRELETARKRFVAHRQMLEGLLAWKAFNTYGSDDLEFFMREQLEPTLALYLRGVADQRILDHLMTELADLYHKPGKPLRPESL